MDFGKIQGNQSITLRHQSIDKGLRSTIFQKFSRTNLLVHACQPIDFSKITFFTILDGINQLVLESSV